MQNATYNESDRSSSISKTIPTGVVWINITSLSWDDFLHYSKAKDTIENETLTHCSH